MPPALSPTLNWCELAKLIDVLRPEVEGLHVERVIVPERKRFPAGYLKGEWAIRLTGRKTEKTLIFSIRPRHPYIYVAPERKGPRAAPAGTRSVFDLELSKYLKGAKVLGLEALPNERYTALWFSASGKKLGLVLALIPAAAEGFLVEDGGKLPWKILARSRPAKDPSESATFTPPRGENAPKEMPVRGDLLDSPETYLRAVHAALDEEAFDLRRKALEKSLREQAKQSRDRLRQCETAIKEAQVEANWETYGTLMKSVLQDPPAIQKDPKTGTSARNVFDYTTQQYLWIPADPKLGPQAQVEKFFQLARRKNRKIDEAKMRAETFRERLVRAERGLEALPDDWESLEKAERAAGAPVTGTAAKTGRKSASWPGRAFVSKDGLTIWVGRSKDENLELTFKYAKGNDLWLHVRGRPGAHTVVPLSSGKSAPLETLLDAATVTVLFSGGEKIGKTEVDYTYKKHVKRIKDSSEASYTHNKTLMIEMDPVRVKRLTSQSA